MAPVFDTCLAQTSKFRFVPGCPSKAVTSAGMPKEEEALARTRGWLDEYRGDGRNRVFFDISVGCKRKKKVKFKKCKGRKNRLKFESTLTYFSLICR